MRHRLIVCVVAILAAGFLGSSPASAVGGWFVGVNGGSAELQDFRLTVTSSDDSETVLSVVGGYQFMKHFGVAASYVDLGNYHFEGPDFGGYVTDLDVDGFHVFSLGIIPVSSRVALFGTLGVYRWDVKETDIDVPIMFERRLSDTGFSPTYGVGVNVDVFGKSGINLHVDWQTFVDVGDRQTTEHENDYEILSAGITYHFGK